MNTFVIAFRRRPPALSHAERRQLNEETAAWAQKYNGAGHKLEPRILAAESAVSGPESATVRDDGLALSALLFLEARDLKEAAQIAESHPGLRYGFNVEVRPWSKPGAPAAPR